jgi:hypothetical protein
MAAAMVLIFIAAVLMGRFRLNGSRRTLLKLSAVIILVLDNLSSAIYTVSVDAPSSNGFATWAFASHGVIGATLLAVAAVLPDRPVADRRSDTIKVLGGSVALFAGVTGVIALLGSRLPGAFQDLPDEPELLEILSEHPGLVVAEIFTAAAYGVAAIRFAQLAEEHEDEFLKWLGIG